MIGLVSDLREKHYVLWAGLFGVAICQLLNQAPETFMVILQIGVIVHFMTDQQLIREVDRELVIPICIILFPLFLNLFFPGELTKDRYATGLVWSLFLISSFWIISERQATNEITWLPTTIITVLCGFFLAQSGVFLLKKYSREIFPFLQRYVLKTNFAMFSNIHLFALFAVIALPVSFFCIWKSRRPVLKVLLSLCALCGMYLLLKTGSRPSWLALISAGLVALPFARGKIRFYLFGVLSCVPLG